MILSHINNRFQVKCSYQEFLEHGRKIKDARFRWDPAAKVWWTDSTEKASLLISCADDSARAVLEARHQKRQESITASRAHDADLGDALNDLGIEPYPFQRAGIAYARDKETVLFGDEPGLGKTLQVLATIHVKQSYPCLAIVPASLKINWRKEAIRCIPELRAEGAVRIISGRATGGDLIETNDPKPKLWIINYNILQSWLPKLATLGLQSVICDESHLLKNPKAQRTLAALELITGIKHEGRKKSATGPAIRERYLLSGTALVNRPAELKPQLELLGVLDRFGGGWEYMKRFCDARSEWIWVRNPKTKKADHKLIWHFDGATNTAELQRLLRENVMVRRLKDDVLTELPPKRHQAIEIANGLQKFVDEEDHLYFAHARTIAELEVERDAARDRGDFETFEGACARLDKAHRVFFNECAKLAHTIAVAKIPHAIEYCLEILEGQEKLAVFAHHHDVVFALEAAFREAGIEAVRLTGMDSAKAKDAAIEAFQTGTARVFIGSLQAAGVGITLTRASQAVMVELDWTPGVMDQAADRLHRIGQKDSVLITYLVVENSIDSKKVGMLISKREVLRAVLDDPLDEFNLPKGDSEEAKTRTQHAYTDDEKKAVQRCLQLLAENCDGARMRDGAGFNKIDSYFGRALAYAPRLSDKQTQKAKMMIQKYHRQVPDDMFEAVYPGLRAKWEAEKLESHGRG